ncbi:hypothetical protein B0G81_7504 [Paraburkholderia sp. BL6665CI2N2]|nr:hypothetical protein B0G81_7504 [Paraburkholderia sp. BL6665CI2N2]
MTASTTIFQVPAIPYYGEASDLAYPMLTT